MIVMLQNHLNLSRENWCMTHSRGGQRGRNRTRMLNVYRCVRRVSGRRVDLGLGTLDLGIW